MKNLILIWFAILSATAIAGEPNPYSIHVELSRNSPDDRALDDALGAGIGFTYAPARWGITLIKDFQRSFGDTNAQNTHVEGDLDMWRLGVSYTSESWFGFSAGVAFSELSRQLTPAFCPPGLDCTTRIDSDGTGFFMEARAYPKPFVAAYYRITNTGADSSATNNLQEHSLGIRIEIRF